MIVLKTIDKDSFRGLQVLNRWKYYLDMERTNRKKKYEWQFCLFTFKDFVVESEIQIWPKVQCVLETSYDENSNTT